MQKDYLNGEIPGSLFHNIPQLIIYVNNDRKVEFTNRPFNLFFNVTPEQIIGKPIDMVFSGLHSEQFSAFFNDKLREHPVDFISTVEVNRKNKRHFKISARPYISGKTSGYLFVYTDITDVVKPKKEKNEKIYHYKNFIDNLNPEYFFYSYDKEGRFSYVSSNFEQIAGVKVNEVIGEKWFELIQWEKFSKEEGLKTMHDIIDSGNRSGNVTMKFYKPGDKAVYLKLYGTPQYDKYGNLTGVDGFGQDVTQTIRLQNELINKNKKLLLAIETGKFGMWEYDLGLGKAIVKSHNWHTITGFNREDNKVPIFDKWAALTPPDTQKKLLNSIKSYSLGKIDSFEMEIDYNHPEKGWIILYIGSKLVRDKNNKPSKILGITKDITDLKKGEIRMKKLSQKLLQSYYNIKKQRTQLEESNKKLKFLQDRLVQTEKMNSVGTLAAGIAHEINNPINFINAGLESLKKHYQKTVKLVQEELPNDQKKIENKLKKQTGASYEMFDVIKQGIVQTQKIIRSLRTYTSSNTNSEFFQLNDIIRLALLMTQNEKDEKIKIKKMIDKMPLIYGSPTEITQLFSNMIINAIHAVKEKGGGEIKIKTNYKILEKKVIIEIEDTGTGIPEKIQDKIFEPFFTTKEVDKGTGLGLYNCYNIVKKHQGSISFNSEEGKGTRFIISLPLNY